MPASKRPLYAVLHLTPEASSSDIARAYRRLALQFHPDRDPNGTDEFKRIANAYAVLSDVEQRRLYDATGLAPGGDGSGSAADATTAATPQERSAALASQLRAFFATYAGSDEEADDVAASYAACDGDFARMLRNHLVFDNGRAGEVQRLYALTRRLIETAHRLTATAAWTRSTTPAALRKLERAMAKERAQAEEALREMGLSASTAEEATHDTNKSNNTTTSAHGGGHDTMLALQSMMQQRQRSAWANMVADLEDKYVKKTKPPATARQSSRKRSTRDADAEGNTTTSPSSTRRAKRQKQSASRRTRTSAHDVLMTAQRDKASVPPPPSPSSSSPSSSASCASPSLLHARDKPVGDDDDDVDAAATTTAPPLPPAMASLLRELRAQQASAQDTAAASEAAVVKLGTEADDGTHVDLTEHASSLLQPYKARRQSSSSSSPRAAGGGAVSLLSPTERAALTRLLTDAMCSEYARQQQQTAERAAVKDDEDDGKGSSSTRYACRPDKDDDDDKTASPAARVDAATRDVLRYQASMELHWLEEWAANSHSDVSNNKSNNSSDDGDAALAWRRRRIKRAVLERAELHKPLAYILGSQPFFGCDIACAPPLLCPRTETELWVQWYVTTYLQPAQQQEQQQQEQQQQEQRQRWWRRLMKRRGRLPSASSTRDAVRVLDMCCGTGCIGVAVAKHVPESCIVAADVDEAAVRMTRHNAQRNGIGDERMTVLQSDMFAAFMQDNGNSSSSSGSATTARRASAVTVARAYAHSFDAVLCNPPYILPHEYDSMPARVRRWETRLALVGDAARVWRQHSYFQELCEVAPRLLKPRSRRCAALRDGPNLCVEVGTQAEVVARLFEQCGRGVWGDVQLHLDATQQPRWLTASLLH